MFKNIRKRTKHIKNLVKKLVKKHLIVQEILKKTSKM